jgi:hypothetical protein
VDQTPIDRYLAWLGFGATVIFGGLALAGLIRRRTGLAFAALGVGILSYGLFGLLTGKEPLEALGLWMRNDLMKGMLLGGLVVLLALGAAIAAYRLYIRRTTRDQSRESSSPVTTVVVHEDPIVPMATMDRLREAFEPCRAAMELAREELTRLCMNRDDGGWGPGPKSLIARLLNLHVASPLFQSMLTLYDALFKGGDIRLSQLHEIKLLFRKALDQYGALCRYLLWGGPVLIGGDPEKTLPALSPLFYGLWYERHQKALDALRLLRLNRDFGLREVTENVEDLERLLSPPPVGTSTAASAG